METVVAKADLENEKVFQAAAEILKQDGLVAFPTETVYGLGGDALKADAASKIYSSKRKTV